MFPHATPRPSRPISPPSINHSPITDLANDNGEPPSTWAGTSQFTDSHSLYSGTPYIPVPFLPFMTPPVTSDEIAGGRDALAQELRSNHTYGAYSIGYSHSHPTNTAPFVDQHTKPHPSALLQDPASMPSQENGPSPIRLFAAPFVSSMDPTMTPGVISENGSHPPQTSGLQQTHDNYPLDYTGYPWGPPKVAYPQPQQTQPHLQYQPHPQQSDPWPFRGAARSDFIPNFPAMGAPWPQIPQQPLPFPQLQPQGLWPTMPFPGIKLGGVFFGCMMMVDPWVQMLPLQPLFLQAQMMQQPPLNHPFMPEQRRPWEHVFPLGGDQFSMFSHNKQTGFPSRNTPWPVHPHSQQPQPQSQHQQHQPPSQPVLQQSQPAGPFSGTNPVIPISNQRTRGTFSTQQRESRRPIGFSAPQVPESSSGHDLPRGGNRTGPSTTENPGTVPQSAPGPVRPQVQHQPQQPWPSEPFDEAWTIPIHDHLPVISRGSPWGGNFSPQPEQATPRAQPSEGVVGGIAFKLVDQVGPFMQGDHYGPVLEPLLVHVVDAKLRINPLLQPVLNDVDRPHLTWNMLFPSNDCHRSTDPSDVSWMEGRHEPATFPRVTSLRIVSEGFPWTFEIKAGRPEIGVTCGDLINGISRSLNVASSKSDYETLPRVKKRLVMEAYQRNRSRAYGVPGGVLDSAMKRLDFLSDTHTYFGGIVNDEDYLGRAMATKWVQIQEESVGNFVMW